MPRVSSAVDLTLAESIAAIVGGENVIQDEAARLLASSDLFLWPDAVIADLVVRPQSTDEVSRTVSLLANNGAVLVPRGAGLSYTAGAVPHTPATIVDTGGLQGIEVEPEDLVAVVGAGCTWQRVAEALKPYRLRAAQSSPISGNCSTVGGAVSQNVPGGLDGIIGLTVVLADGTIVRTGSGAQAATSRFQRYSGPDLTGLFLGDCGAFGIKTEIVLRLVPDHPAAFASFAFANANLLITALVAVLRKQLVSRAFAMDRAKGEAATAVDIGEAAKIVGSVVKSATSVGKALKDVAQLARGRAALHDHPWSLHLTAEAVTETAAEAQLDMARDLIGRLVGDEACEIDNIVPKTLRARPYSVRGMVGLEGERWVPVHGLLPLSSASTCMGALQAHLAAKAQELASNKVAVQWVISSVGAYVTLEPMFFWRDALDAIHLIHLSARNRARFGGAAANPSARDLVRRVRVELRDIMDQHGAVHAQVGRFYGLAGRLDPGSRDLLVRIKRALDPDGRMNPGALEL